MSADPRPLADLDRVRVRLPDGSLTVVTVLRARPVLGQLLVSHGGVTVYVSVDRIEGR